MNRVRKVFLIAGSLLLGLLLVTSLALAALGNNLENISQTSTDAGYPAIAVSQNGLNIGIVWTERFAGGGLAQGPLYIKSSDDGSNLSLKTVIDSADNLPTNQSLTPDIASSPGSADSQKNMHVVWKNLTGSIPQTKAIKYARCPVKSSCTDYFTLVTLLGTSSDDVSTPRVATNVDLGGVHVVWQQLIGGNRVIKYLGKSSSGTWQTTPTSLSDSGGVSSHPAIAVSKASDGFTYVHVAWASNSSNVIQYIRGTVDGSSGLVTGWSTIKPLPTINSTSSPDYPAVAANGDRVAVLWDVHYDFSGNNDRYYAVYVKSSDKGINFNTEALDINTNSTSVYTPRPSDNKPGTAENNLLTSVHAARLQIQATMQPTTTTNMDAVLYAVWHQTVDAGGGEYKHDVFYSAQPLGTCAESCNNWGAVTNETTGKKFGSLPNEPFYSMSPDIAVGRPDGRLHVVYMETKNDYDLENSIVDIIYNGTGSGLKDRNPKVSLPIILKGK